MWLAYCVGNADAVTAALPCSIGTKPQLNEAQRIRWGPMDQVCAEVAMIAPDGLACALVAGAVAALPSLLVYGRVRRLVVLRFRLTAQPSGAV